MKDQVDVAEIEFVLPCQDCGCHAVFMAPAESGKRSNAPYARCCQCGRERRDLSNAALSIDGNGYRILATAGDAGALKWPVRLPCPAGGKGQEAIAVLKAHPEVRATVLDLAMPVMSGDRRAR